MSVVIFYDVLTLKKSLGKILNLNKLLNWIMIVLLWLYKCNILLFVKIGACLSLCEASRKENGFERLTANTFGLKQNILLD